MLNLKPSEVPSTGGSSTPVLEAGVYPGVISLIMDLGVQREKKYDSRAKPDDSCTDADFDIGHYVWFSFAFPTERYEVEYDGETFERDQIIGQKYKVSNSDKSNLIKMYNAVVKDGRNFGEMIGMPVTVTTGLTSGGKPKVVSVAGPMRGTQVAEPLKKPMVVSEADYDNIDNLDLPEFLTEMVKNRVE